MQEERKMTKLLALTTLLLAAATQAFAGSVVGPEIDATSGMTVLALLSGGVLVLRARRKK
jgi:hypothetical protein